MIESEVAPYLLRLGLLDIEAVAGGGVRIIDTSRRNVNFRVVGAGPASYLVKTGVADDGFSSSEQEAAVYRFLWSSAGPAGVTDLLPRLFAFDDEREVLVLELFADATDLRHRHRRTGRCSKGIAARIGAALATLHGQPLPDGVVPAHGLIAPLPPGLYLHRPALHVLNELSAAGLEVLQLAQSVPDVGEALDLLRKEWSPSNFIHGDVRWDNILVFGRSSRRARIKLVDWEVAGMGDPAWDLGSLFGEYLSMWLTSIPFDGTYQPDACLELARYPLPSVQPPLRACWDAYVRTARAESAGARDLLTRVARFTGLKLMQNSVEHVAQAPTCTPTAVHLLQLGFNMVVRPHDALATVLAIPSPEEGG